MRSAKVDDNLSRMLRLLKPERASFATAQVLEPWRVAGAPQGLIAYYHVVEGACSLQVTGLAAVELSEGDVALVTRGDAHDIACAGPGCRLVHGHLMIDTALCAPLLSLLPAVARIHVPRDDKLGSLHGLVASAMAPQPGAAWLLAKASEVLLAETLRRHLAGGPAPREEWLAGLRDRVVGRCLNAMHDRPADKWTLERLAREANTSRSVLAERFTRLVGLPPMSYLTRWRMNLAAELLNDSTLGLSRIAGEVGYDTDTAFSRAFRREFGKPPAAWRRERIANA